MRRDVFLGAAALARLVASQDDSNGENQIKGCFPDDPTAPCVSIANIEAICMQPGISLGDHKTCMCDGSYFQDWLGCRQCLRVNGALSENEVRYWSSVMADASSKVCDSVSAPTTWVRDYFTSVQNNVSPPTGTDDAKRTLVSATDVSLYYTVPSSQGPGITPTVTPSAETGTSSGSGTTTGRNEITTTGSDRSQATGTGAQNGSGQSNGVDKGVAHGFYDQDVARIAGAMAGAALVLLM